MDKEPTQKSNRLKEGIAIVLMTVVLVVVYGFLQSDFAQDSWKAWWYKEPASVSTLRQDLELTGTGERIFLATQPAIEEAEAFNEHCGEHRDDVSLLGCYNDGRIYVYDVKLDSLRDSNKVTAAHELLHAVWSRLSRREKEQLEGWLEDFKREKIEWVEGEVNLYGEQERLEELYVRIGTKLRDIPDELEKHYQEYFLNRLKIVDYYENYQAPFRELHEKNETIRVKVATLGAEIEQERADYEKRSAALTQRIEEFNLCAGTAGCFATDGEFTRQRAELETERLALAELRTKLNKKIDENNQLVMEYEENRKNLGELNDAMNSNIDKIEDGI